jgi:hypothetical protein
MFQKMCKCPIYTVELDSDEYLPKHYLKVIFSGIGAVYTSDFPYESPYDSVYDLLPRVYTKLIFDFFG